ncbi:MAG TPA: phage tail protein [Arachnia sp.]|nr:phage tail protein [Arachnia sp.]HMT85300.1 phage tail protein [Arachnia sp.]
MAEVRAATTPFYRFSGATGWPEVAEARGLSDDPSTIRLGTPGRRPVAWDEPFGSFGGLRLPRGVAIGGEGRLFLADPRSGVVRSALAGELVAGSALPDPLWPRREAPDPWHLEAPSDVALTADGDLAIADPAAGRVLVLAWPTAVRRRDLRVPGWRPTALAATADGDLIVADPGLGRLHRFDRNGARRPGWPHASVPLLAPDFLAVGPPTRAGQIVFVLDRGRKSGRPSAPAGAHAVVAIGADGYERSGLLPERLMPPALRREGERLLWDDPAFPARRPLVLPALPLSRDGRWNGIPMVAVPGRATVPRSGEVVFQGMDSRERGFAWDRIVLDLEQPETASLVITTLTSDTPIAPDRIGHQSDAAWSRPLVLNPNDLPEVLVQSSPGRWLWVRLELLSDGASSPVIRRLDVHGPRRSGLRHLPATFSQDPQSRDFLDRFLAYFDTVFAEISRAHHEVGRLFDPAAVPADAWLDWLGSWFDLRFPAEWDIASRRELVAAATDIARARGTRAGLQRMLRWHLGLTEPWPIVIEHFHLGPDAPPVGGVPLPTEPEAHRMTIVVPRSRVPDDDDARRRLHRLVDGWIPAHTTACLRLVDSGVVLGHQSLLGVDTLLSGSGPEPLDRGRAGIDLATVPPTRGPRPSDYLLADPSGGHHV